MNCVSMPQRTFETMGKPAVPSRYAMVEPPCVWCYSIQRIQHRQISSAVSSQESGNDIQVNLQQDPDSISSPNCNIHLGLSPPEPIPRSGCDPRRRCQMRFPKFGSYTLMELASRKIVDFQLVQVR